MKTETIKFGGECDVPRDVAVCPECGERLHVDSNAYDPQTGLPYDVGLEIDCLAHEIELENHKWNQSDWQPIYDAIAAWCGAIKYVGAMK